MESFSVKAVLSALDKGFTSTIKSSVSSLNGIKNAASSATSSIMKIASGIGVFKAVSAIGNGITGLIGDMGEASAAWKTFEGNMTMNGTAASEIQDIKRNCRILPHKQYIVPQIWQAHTPSLLLLEPKILRNS